MAELDIVAEIHAVELFPSGAGVLQNGEVVFLGVGEVAILCGFSFLEDAVNTVHITLWQWS